MLCVTIGGIMATCHDLFAGPVKMLSPFPESHRRILLTGFDAFGGAASNASWETVRRLDGWRTDGFVVRAVQLPTAFVHAPKVLCKAIEDFQPDIVIATGQAESRHAVSLERLARNLDDAPIPDNAGDQPRSRRIAAAGPDEWHGSLPLDEIAAALGDAGVPVETSCDAGNYVCNHVFYRLMEYVADRPSIKAGFIHLPVRLSLDDLVRAMKTIVRISVEPARSPDEIRD